MIEWLKWGALLLIAGFLFDVAYEVKLLREEIAVHRNWYMEDDGK